MTEITKDVGVKLVEHVHGPDCNHVHEQNSHDSEEIGEEDDDRKQREMIVKAYNKSAWKNVYRSKGMFWVATQNESIFTWQQAGIVNE